MLPELDLKGLFDWELPAEALIQPSRGGVGLTATLRTPLVLGH